MSLVAGPRVLRGTVQSCAGAKLTIAYGHARRNEPRPQRDVDAATTWTVGEPAEAAVGDVGACHYGRDLWRLCEVTAAEGGRHRVATPEGLVREIDAVDIVVLQGEHAATVREHMASRAAQRAFDEAVLAATYHRGPLAKGGKVVAPRVGTTFYEATIVSQSNDAVRVRWTNASWPEREVPARHVGVVTDDPGELAPGRIVLWRTRGGDDRFEPARVVAQTNAALTLRDAQGATRTESVDALDLVLAVSDGG